jgi:hypothetical protein
MTEFEPDKPDISVIETIHRGKDAFVGFVRKPNRPKYDKNGNHRNFENLASISTSNLEREFSRLSIWLYSDSYFTVNSPFRAAFWKNNMTGFPDVERKEKNLRYLNACYVDLDIGRPNDELPEKRLTFPAAMNIVSSLIKRGEIPQPSIIARSGRGAYLLWLLCEKGKPEKPPGAWPETIVLYKQINKAIGNKLTAVAWDKCAHDAARVLRVPGSIHSKVKCAVHYEIQYDENGNPLFYSLEELASLYNIKIKERILPAKKLKILSLVENPKYRKTKNKGSRPKGIKGQKSLNKKRIQDLISLEKHEGGFKKGFRRRRLTLYAELLRRLYPEEKTIKAVKKMARNCNPPYPSDATDPPIETIVKNIYSGKPGSVRNWTNPRLCKELRINYELAKELNLITIVLPEITKERKNQPGKREIERQKRHDAILEILKENINMSSRKIAKILNENGIKGNHSTVNKKLPEIRKELLQKRMDEKRR